MRAILKASWTAGGGPRGLLRASIGLVAGLVLTVLSTSPAAAVLIEIPLNPVLGEDAIQLDYVAPGGPVGFDQFTIEFVSAAYEPDPYVNETGQRVGLEFDVTFGDSALSGFEPEYMMVFTSVRHGVAGIEPTCAELGPGGNLFESDFVYAQDGFSGDYKQGGVTIASDSVMTGKSQVCNAEDTYAGDAFSSVIFESTPGQKLRLGIEIEQTADGIDAAAQLGNLGIMLQGYRAPIPEPNTGLLVLMGLVALATYSKSRSSNLG